MAYRSLRVAGATHGEADLGARIVQHAELTTHDGLTLLLRELPSITGDRVPARLVEGPPTVLEDPARRGVLFALPAAIEHCLASGPGAAVLVPWRGAAPPGWRSVVEVVAGGRHLCVGLRDVAGGLEVSAVDESPPVGTGVAQQTWPSSLLVDAEDWARARRAAQPYLVADR